MESLHLGFTSILLIIIFKGQTEQLIPLYAVGVFIPFTLSQTGMLVKWMREKPKGWMTKLIINFIGAFISFVGYDDFLYYQIWSKFGPFSSFCHCSFLFSIKLKTLCGCWRTIKYYLLVNLVCQSKEM